jgi:hypothetical protein
MATTTRRLINWSDHDKAFRLGEKMYLASEECPTENCPEQWGWKCAQQQSSLEEWYRLQSSKSYKRQQNGK